MGIESDQLVYDYLSRVGDLAQQQQLPSGARMRLVSTLRGEIDRQRGTDGSDSPAVVRRIIGRLGTPAELVAAAAGSGDGAVALPSPRAGSEPAAAEPRGVPRPRRGLLRKDALRKGASDAPAAREEAGDEGPVPGWPSASAPHMTGLNEAGPLGGEPDWWRIEPGPFGGGTSVPGFVGGLESPELLRPPRPEEEKPGAAEAAEAPGKAAEEAAAVPRPRRLRLRRRSATAPAPAPEPVVAARASRLAHPFLLLSAALLVTGAVLGSWVALAGGWLLAYSSRKLSRTEAKWVAMGLPGAVAAGALVWLWGRMEGRWGQPIAEGAMKDAMSDAWPVVVRTAAVASALYLVWRSRRLPG
ncbi:hypothetical protein ABZS61_25170 [Streptomyces sp. NPDC005566]|uniref:hypothetical protein n=1 Tax=Streptomyces sp. NPDC005566 TaxID=3156886 RepID=UPI0033A104CB